MKLRQAWFIVMMKLLGFYDSWVNLWLVIHKLGEEEV
jgi:hypothetical protein